MKNLFAESYTRNNLLQLLTLSPNLRATNQLLAITPNLETNPFQETLDRPVFFNDYINIIKNKVILITGGKGFIATQLASKLAQAKLIVLVDKETDVSNYKNLNKVFNIYKPDIVFHLAAQRLPGLAEILVKETIEAGVMGTINIIKLCDKYQVKSCVFASSGKASRFYTTDVYASCKKISECLIVQEARESRTKYAIVRFTHVVENSPISAEISAKIKTNVLNLHAPDRYTYAQTAEEALSLLLNSLSHLKAGEAPLFVINNLGWPINTLDIALYKLHHEAEPHCAIYFEGIPAGYETKTFTGYIDLDREINPMLNVLEPYTKVIDGMLIAKSAFVTDTSFTPSFFTKGELQMAVKSIACDMFKWAPKQQLNKIALNLRCDLEPG